MVGTKGLDQISLCILKITQFLSPFIPNGAEKVYSTFGLDESYLSFDKFDEIIKKINNEQRKKSLRG